MGTQVLTQQDVILLVINFAVAFLIPLFVNIVTNSQASERFKTVFVLLTTAIVGALTPFLTGVQSLGDANWWLILFSVVQVWMTSIATHYGFWKPAGVTGTEGAISNRLPGGVGGGSSSEDPPAGG